ARAVAIPMISLAFLTTWGQSGASGCSTINHWPLGARKPYGARLFGVFALVQIGFKSPFGERRTGEFGRKARDAPDRRAGVFREAQPADIVGRRSGFGRAACGSGSREADAEHLGDKAA